MSTVNLNDTNIPNNIPTMLTIKETSQKTGLAMHHLRQLCLENKIVYVRAGAKYLINLERLVESLNTGQWLEETM